MRFGAAPWLGAPKKMLREAQGEHQASSSLVLTQSHLSSGVRKHIPEQHLKLACGYPRLWLPHALHAGLALRVGCLVPVACAGRAEMAQGHCIL